MTQKSDFTNHAGGAYGADTFWDLIGRQNGFMNHNHYREQSNSKLSNHLAKRNIHPVIVSASDIDEGYLELEKLYNKPVQRSLVNNLKARNYIQVRSSEGVYAITEFVGVAQVKGGTNVAIQLGIKYNKEVYVFDIKLLKWFSYDYFINRFNVCDTPILTQNYAGIGTRNIELYNIKKDGSWIPSPNYVGNETRDKVVQAIRDVYTRTIQVAINT